MASPYSAIMVSDHHTDPPQPALPWFRKHDTHIAPRLHPWPLTSLPRLQADAPKRRTFRKFTFRGIDLEKLMDLDSTAVMELMHARVRRRFSRGLKRKPMSLIKRLRKEKTKVAPGEKPDAVKTHLRNMIIVPEMIGSVVGGEAPQRPARAFLN